MVRVRAVLLSVLIIVVACADGSTSGTSPSTTEPISSTPVTSSPASSMVASTEVGSTLHYVAFGDSWPEGAHCNGCTPFPELWLEALEGQTGMEIEFFDFMGERERSTAEGKMSASLLGSLQTNEETRTAVADADVILISTGPNEIGDAAEAVKAGTCGGADGFDCIRALGETWSSNFNQILTEIETLRDGNPTAIRLVNAANPFVLYPEMSEGMPPDFATTGGALMFELLSVAMCDAAAAHEAVCLDARPLIQVSEDSQESMQAVADALAATGLPELD